jgi:hypothetical protein
MVTFDADLIPASSSTTGAARNTPSCFRIQPTIRLTKRRQSAGRAASASASFSAMLDSTAWPSRAVSSISALK